MGALGPLEEATWGRGKRLLLMKFKDLLQHAAHPVDVCGPRVDHILLTEKECADVGHECIGDVKVGTLMPIDSSHSTSN